jgi:hypothetical protein
MNGFALEAEKKRQSAEAIDDQFIPNPQPVPANYGCHEHVPIGVVVQPTVFVHDLYADNAAKLSRQHASDVV